MTSRSRSPTHSSSDAARLAAKIARRYATMSRPVSEQTSMPARLPLHLGASLAALQRCYLPFPSTAAANTPWNGRFRVRGLRSAEEVWLAA